MLHHTDRDQFYPLTNDIRTEHVSRLTKEYWLAAQPQLHVAELRVIV